MDDIINTSTLKEQLLELMMLDIRYFGKDSDGNYLPVTKLPIELKNFLKEYPVGGIILFRENLQDIHEIKQLTSDLQENSYFGRFISIDQEGGVVSRIKGATDTPGNMALGAINDYKITSKIASLIAKELSALGINFNLAPCLDVNSNHLNPIIGVRSFGSDVELVSKHGASYIEGLQDEQIISCAKHFPGHGNVDTDTHFEDTYLNSSVNAIANCDLKPFEAAINVNVDCIMTAHIIAPALDNSQIYSNKLNKYVDTPATLSHTILNGILRGKLQYQGIIISDALDMKAISDKFTEVEATILALEAGIDIILMPVHIWDTNGIQKFISYFNQVLAICENSIELKESIKESLGRILQLKHFYTMEEYSLDIIGCEAHKEFAQQTANRAITINKNSKNILPLQTNPKDKFLIIATKTHLADIAHDSLAKLGLVDIDFLDLDMVDNTTKIEDADKILVLTYNLTKVDNRLNKLINQLNNLDKPYVMLSCRNPYDILYVDDARTNVLVYGATGLDQTNNKINDFTLNLTEAIIKLVTI